MSDIEIEIDGKQLTAKPNSMVIEVADAAGIYIPRFCYHKHLKVVANCRMCLVEVEKSPKALPACATPIMPGMKIFTRSPKALAAQKAVMEFLLINHPLDCPICDQGGECELQDLSLGYGAAESYFSEGKRAVADKDIGPLIETEMTRCIHCTRCVRFGDEIAGIRELGATGRGEDMEIGTFIEKSLLSEVSGNVIDLCPVGALTSKPFRFKARAWELAQYPTIAAHDCLGSNINAHTRTGSVMRFVPRENNQINQTWISDRDRYSYQGLTHSDRLTTPLIKIAGEWQEATWAAALEFAANGLQNIIAKHGPEQIAALASPNSTVEEFYLLQKLMRQLGSHHIDHRARQTDFSDQDQMGTFPGCGFAITDIANSDVIIVVGANVAKDQPLAAVQIRQAARRGAKVIAINMRDYDYRLALSAKKIVAPHQFCIALAEIVQALGGVQQVNDLAHSHEDALIADAIRQGQDVKILVGLQAGSHPEAANIRALVQLMADAANAQVGYLTDGANSAGAWLAGAVPHRLAGGGAISVPGLNAKTMFDQPRQSYILMNIEPNLDYANRPAMTAALEQAELVVALSIFRDPLLQQYADVILPITPYTETSGTLVNMSGQWQTFTGVATPLGQARPGWKVLRVLGNVLHCVGFDYESSSEISAEVTANLSTASSHATSRFELKLPQLAQAKSLTGVYSRVADIPLYATDSIVRRAEALQKTQHIIEGNLIAARLHPQTAADLHIKEMHWVTAKQGDATLRLPVIFDLTVPPGAVAIATALDETSSLGELFGLIELEAYEHSSL